MHCLRHAKQSDCVWLGHGAVNYADGQDEAVGEGGGPYLSAF